MNDAPARPSRSWTLIGPAVLAMILATSPARAEDEAATAAIQKAGGKIERDDKAPDKPVRSVNLGVTAADDAALTSLKGFSKIEKITLNNTSRRSRARGRSYR